MRLRIQKENSMTESQPQKLWNKNFFLLWQGQFVSAIGSQIHYIAVMLWIWDTTNSATFMGLVSAITGIIGVLLSPIGGAFADMHSRKVIIVISDLVNGIIICIFAAIAFFVTRVDIALAVLITVAIISAIMNSFFMPAINASIPDIVPGKKLAGANSMSQMATQTSQILGSGLAGLLYSLLGGPILFLFNGISFIFSCISETFISIPQKLPEKSKSFKIKIAGFKNDILEGFQFVWNMKGLRQLILLSAILSFFSAPIILFIPIFVENYLHVGKEWVGFLISAYGFGNMAGFALAGFLTFSKRLRTALMIFAMLVEPALFGIMSFLGSPYVILILALTAGILSGFIAVYVTTLLQIVTPQAIRGRVFGVLTTLVGGLTPISLGLSGIAADLLQHNLQVLYTFCSSIMVMFSLSVILKKDFRHFLSSHTSTMEIKSGQETSVPAAESRQLSTISERTE